MFDLFDIFVLFICLLKDLLTGGLLQTNNDIAIDMTKGRSQGLGFARIAKLVTNKNANILKKEAPTLVETVEKEVNMNGARTNEENRPE